MDHGPGLRLNDWLSGFIGDGIDLYLDAGDGELAYHGGAGWLGDPEELGVDLVHGGEILAVRQKDAALHHVRQGRAAAFQNALDVV